MLTCFVDESGCPGSLPAVSSSVQPLLVIAGIALDPSAVASLTRQYVRLVQRHHYGQSRPADFCADLQREILKGADMRRAMRKDGAATGSPEVRLLDKVLALLHAHGARLFGCVLVKAPGQPLDGAAAYSHGLVAVVRDFYAHLEERGTCGHVIADFREAQLNGRASRELMAAKWAEGADRLPLLPLAPAFGNSEMHAPLQLADLVCSALLWPIAAWRFRQELEGSPLQRPVADAAIARRFRKRLLALKPAGSGSGDGVGAAASVQEGYRVVPLAAVLGVPGASAVKPLGEALRSPGSRLRAGAPLARGGRAGECHSTRSVLEAM